MARFMFGAGYGRKDMVRLMRAGELHARCRIRKPEALPSAAGMGLRDEVFREQRDSQEQ
ncbi:MAG TPA: hypothetical protein PLQ35_08235 [bacterium]|nr:hypothetical protein [bacterium]HQL62268.1 hypothetical protein [bacterium]